MVERAIAVSPGWGRRMGWALPAVTLAVVLAAALVLSPGPAEAQIPPPAPASGGAGASAGSTAGIEVPAGAQSAADTQSTSGEAAYLRPGDQVRIQVWRQPEFSGEFRVTAQGVIGHPLYRSVQAAGRPLDEVEAELRRFLERFEVDPNFVFEPSFNVSVFGQVRSPGTYPLLPGTTLTDAIVAAGGTQETGRLDRVTLQRDGVERVLDLSDPGAETRELTVRSGDELIVARQRNVFREYMLPALSAAGSIASLYRVFRLRR